MSVEPERIRARAYQLWENEGCQEGRSLEYWLRAEQELESVGENETGEEIPPREVRAASVVSLLNEKKQAGEKKDSLESAIEETFPCSDPVASASPVVSGSPQTKSTSRQRG